MLEQADATLYHILLYFLLAARNELNFPSLYAGKLRLSTVKLTPLDREIHADSKYLHFNILL